MKYIVVVKLDEKLLKRIKSFFKLKKIAEHKNTEDYFYGKIGRASVMVRVAKCFKTFEKPYGYLIVRRNYSESRKSLRVDFLFGDVIYDKKEIFNFRVFKQGGKNERKENKNTNAGVKTESSFISQKFNQCGGIVV